MTTRAILIKNYLTDLFAQEDEILSTVRKRAQEQGLPDIHVPSNVGKLIYMLAKIRQPKRVLEIGTLAGYSTIWLCRAIPPDGKIITLECDRRHVEIASQNLAYAGFQDKVEIRCGKAGELMDQMAAEGEDPFDLIFIDADKENYPFYLNKSVTLAHAGTLILSDNLIPKGDEIGLPQPKNLEATGINQFNRDLAAHSQLESILATTIVGSSGRIDGLGISVVK